MAYLILAVLLTVLAGLSAHYLALKKRRAVRPWVIVSVLFILPVFLLALLPAKDEQDTLFNGA